MCKFVQRVLLMDEISTGLDSATTYSVVKFLCNTTHVMGLTTMIGLLQPPPEVYALFDDVLLLTDGYALKLFFLGLFLTSHVLFWLCQRA